MPPMSSSPSPFPSTQSMGRQGEALVAQWLMSQGWHILARQWSCRWGELDLVAFHPTLAAPGGVATDPCIAFVEVKTRSRGSWDAAGLMAITPAKRRKLWKTAQLFLGRHPCWQRLPCRFDVALVAWHPHPTPGQGLDWKGEPADAPRGLVLQDYIERAFDS